MHFTSYHCTCTFPSSQFKKFHFNNCYTFPERFVIMWKKDSQILAQEKLIFGDNKKLSVMKNNTLVLKNIGEEDTGNYSCIIMVGDDDNVNVTHEVLVETAPRITSLAASGGSARNIIATQTTLKNYKLKVGDVLLLRWFAMLLPHVFDMWKRVHISFSIFPISFCCLSLYQ